MIDALIHHQFFGLFLTLAVFYAAQKLQQRHLRIVLFNPVILSMFVIAALLYFFHIPYRAYMTGANWLNLLLGPATVALAIPLYKQLKILRHQALAIGVGIMAAAATASIVAAALLQMLGGGTELQMAIMMKSVSTPITIGLADKLHIDSSLAVFMVFTTGTIGTLITAAILKLFKITDDETVGLALGVTAHGLGTARALQISERAGAFAALGMSLMGVISAILIPYVFYRLLFQ